MQDCLGDMNLKTCIIYLDDLIVYSNTFEEHLVLDRILTRLKECDLKLALEKCFFFKERVNFHQHVVSKDGIETDPSMIDKVRNWPTPLTPEEYPFLDITGYSSKTLQK
jgi:hypothetical protein